MNELLVSKTAVVLALAELMSEAVTLQWRANRYKGDTEAQREAPYAKTLFGFVFRMLTFKIKNDSIPEGKRLRIPDQLVDKALAAAGDDLPKTTELQELVEETLDQLMSGEEDHQRGTERADALIPQGTSREDALKVKEVSA